jgi:hypothetical protein
LGYVGYCCCGRLCRRHVRDKFRSAYPALEGREALYITRAIGYFTRCATRQVQLGQGFPHQGSCRPCRPRPSPEACRAAPTVAAVSGESRSHRALLQATALSALPGPRRGHRSRPRWWHRPPATNAPDIVSFIDGIIVSNRAASSTTAVAPRSTYCRKSSKWSARKFRRWWIAAFRRGTDIVKAPPWAQKPCVSDGHICILGAFNHLSNACPKFYASRRPQLCSRLVTCRTQNIAE